MQSGTGQSTNTSVFGYRKLNTTALKIGNVPKWVPDNQSQFKYAPSVFMYEMGLSTDERTALQMREPKIPKILEFLDMGQTSYQRDSIVDVNRPLFDAQPSEIIFQQFEPPTSYDVILSLRNIDKVARSIKLIQEESPYFTIIPPKLGGNKVAPGMVAAYTIRFTPDERKDYYHQLVCITEREKFLIPVRALGPRSVLDFPDELHFPTAPVKYVSTKTVLVRNVGNHEGKFNMEVTSPFTVEPMEGSLGIGECMQLNVEFKPKRVGDYKGSLTVHYSTGEDICIKLYGGSRDANVRMDKSSVKLDNTFIGMTSQKLVTIHNRSDVIVHYEWKAFATEEEEQMEKEIRMKTLDAEESLAKEAFTKECFRDPTVRDRMSMLTRAFGSRKKHYVDEEKFIYYDEIISIEPPEGEIWPNSHAEISIVFTPDEPTSYSRTIYCDVTGRETRLPFRIKGEGLGPKLQFSFDSLNIENVFVNSSHAYEVILENKGGIEAMYNITPSNNSLFGPNFSFSPNEGVLLPEGVQAIQISFCSSVLGEFDEVFLLTADGAPEPVKLRISGRVIGPIFQFDVSEIKFGLVSCGFVNTAEVTLCNTSEIPMTYQLRVPSDGGKESSQEGNKKADTGPPVSYIREFTIRPSSGTIPPDLSQDIQVDFTPVKIKNYSVVLVVDVEGVGEEVFSLPITAKSVVPQISLGSTMLDYGRCFIGCPCTRYVELVNTTTLPARYEMQPQAEDEFAVFVYSSTSPKGVISPNAMLKVPIQIEVKRLGEMISTVIFIILGRSDPLEVELHYVGEGPVINVSPTHINWSKCPVLTPVSRTVILSNQAVIDAEFECVMTRDRTVFSVEPVSGVVPAEGTLELTVTAKLDDSILFADKLTVVVFYGVNHTLNLTAEGHGTTIVSHPSLHPLVDLGPHFSSRPCSKQFLLTNHGRRKQVLYWVTEGFSIVKMRRAEMANEKTDMLDIGRMHTQKAISNSAPKRPVFQVVPDKLDLEPHESKTITIEGQALNPQVAKERLLCYSIIGRNPQKEHIMSVDVTASFISPVLKFSKEELHFSSVLPPGSKLQVLKQHFNALNVSPLPVTAMFTSNYPFLFGSEAEAIPRMEVKLDVGKESKLVVMFDPAYRPDRHSRAHNSSIEVSYKEHPHKDYIPLKSEVHFPNVVFEKVEVDFGCILNDTEHHQYVQMTNTSPLPVHYQWYFIEQPPVVRSDPANDDEGIDVNSTCEMEDESESSEETKPTEGEQEVQVHVSSTSPPRSQLGSVSNKSSPQQPQDKLDATDEESKEQLKQPSIYLDSSQQQHKIIFDANANDETMPVEQESKQEDVCLMDEEPIEQQAQSEYSEEIATPEKEKADISASSDSSDNKPQPWELVGDRYAPIRIQEIFDILPLHGVLPCGQPQEVQFTFYGHADIACSVIAACKVEGGPTYRVRLSGEASRVQYKFNTTTVDVGPHLYDKVIKEVVTLTNLGKVKFKFFTIDVPDSGELAAGGITVSPASGTLSSLEEQQFTIQYLPGTPEPFSKSFLIQVAHFKPDTITLVGAGVFPTMSLNLPRVDPYDKEDMRIVEQSIVKEFAITNSDVITSVKPAGKKPRPELPPFILDFGYVVYGCVDCHSVTLTNIGYPLISFTMAHGSLQNTGFSVDIGERVKNLPGAPDCESIEFNVKFDPASVRCPLGKVKAQLPFTLAGGPVYWLNLMAAVALPDLTISMSYVNFETVQCGQCKVITIRIKNPYNIKCEWCAATEKPKKKPPKFTPLHVKKKLKGPEQLSCFELYPVFGCLQPGEWVNVKLKFMPTEELNYKQIIPIKVAQNPNSSHQLTLEGVGSEPKIIFSQPLLEFGPVFPFSQGDYQEVNVHNPTSFPIEFYSVDFDTQYLEEEEILRWIKGYNKQKCVLMPPREAGEKLPIDIINAYECDQSNLKTRSSMLGDMDCTAQAESSLSVTEITPSHSQLQVDKSKGDYLSTAVLDIPLSSSLTSSTSLSPPITVMPAFESTSHLLRKLEQGEDLAELQNSPVCTTLAKYMGVDISPEAKLAESRRGVVIMTYGPVMSGKTTQARLLAEQYDGAILTVDSVIIDAISKATTAAGKRARESCIEAMISPVESIPASNAPPSDNNAPKKSSQKGDKEQTKPEQTLAAEQVTNTLYCESPQPFQVEQVDNNSSLNTQNNTLMPARLPEDCVVDILSERLQQPDCQKAAIFDGLTSQFVSTQQTLAGLVLKATNNRKYIFFVNLSMTLEEIKQREKGIEEEKLKQERLEEERRLEEEKAKRDEEARLDQLSEDEYEALSEEMKAQIDARRLKARKERIRLRKEEQQKLLQQKLAMEEARKEEEGRDKSRRNKRKTKVTQVKTEAKVESIKSSRPPSASSIGKQPSLVFRTSALGGLGSTVSLDRPMTPSDSPSEANLAVKVTKKKTRRTSAVLMDDSIVSESSMDRKYKLYEESLVGLNGLMENWIRALGEVKPKKETEPTSGVEDTPTHTTTSKRKSRKETAPVIIDPVPELVVPTTSTGISLTDFDDMEGVGVPVININASAPSDQVFDELYKGGVLPSVEEVLDGMGLGPDGPPIPPPYQFSVVSYPPQRRSRQDNLNSHFDFVASSPDDPNAAVPEEVSKPVSETELPEGPELDQIMATSGRTSKKSSIRSTESTDAGSSKGKPKTTRSQKGISPVPSVLLEEETTRSKSVSPALPAKLAKFRWIIPAKDLITLKMKFISDEVGQIDQTFTFEIVGTKRKYQLFCRGHAIFPSISREPRLVFAHRRNSIRDGEIVHKKYVLSQDKYLFGPLHCGKTRERYREGRYPGNMEKLSIINTSAIICNATFCFEHDTNATTFLLDPPGMVLQPGQTKELTVWAYPKASKHYEDSIVCCIKHNPEPAVFPICCDGVQPELDVDKKLVQFDKVLLHRKETRSLFLRNNTLLPVQWRLSGLDALGNDFSFNQEHGIVQPKSEFELKIHFRASKANNYKRALKLEISDVEQIVGLMHVETIQVHAEAYDVAMDISFPRGADGGLDFQCIRVGDEVKQSIQLKNKGKYDIEFRIMFDSVDGVDLSKYFITTPIKGILYPGDKPTAVQTTFKAEQELTIKEQPVLKCQIIEPHVGENGDVIANIPIRISARAVYSIFSISPVNDINFGSIILNSKRTRSFVIENKGEFEFKYSITKLTQDKQRKSKDPRDARTKSRDGQTSSQLLQKSAGAAKGKPDNNLRYEIPNVPQRLVIGMFTLHPAGATVAVGQSQTISIDCVAESLGKTEEVVAIDIGGRPLWKGRNPLPIQYKIYGEVLLPGINYTDIVSIFEEHRICKKLGLISQHHFKEDGSVGVYGEEDKRFVFHSVIVGQIARAQFKITNPNKIPCDAHIAVKPAAGKGSSKGTAEGFDVEPTKVSISAHSHIYATITFRPTAMQLYNGQFEASVDGPPIARNKMLTFDVQGEGCLPQVTVVKPTVRNHKGLPLLLYRRLLVGRSQILPLVLRNNGNITATAILDMNSGGKSFYVVPSDEEGTDIAPSLPAKSPLIVEIKIGEEKKFDVIFLPSTAKKCKGILRLSLRNNQFEDTPIQLIGEGYEEEVTVDNVRGQVDWTGEEELQQSDSNEEISAVKDNHLQFGDCAVKESRQITFTLTNHSMTNTYWFQWPTGSHLSFLPRTGHLHPEKSKDITVTFKASQPKCLKNVKAFAKLSQIIYSKPLSQVTDWDDSMRSVRWVTIRQQSKGSEQPAAASPNSGNVPSKPPSATERGIADTLSTIGAAKPPVTPAKRKIEEVDPEPSHSIVEDSHREFELFVSALADYAKYSTTTSNVKFRDTFMYQTRSYSFNIVNTGKVAIHYQWVMLDDSGGTVTPVGELHLNDAGSIISEGGDCPAFTFEPTMGKIPVGEEGHFVVKFSPLDVQDMHATFQCVIPNLEESASPLMVTVQGHVLMPYCHFELEESDYLTSGRRSATQKGPFGASAGTALEPNTKVIEFHSCGIGIKVTKSFNIINPTSQAYEFFWTNEDGINSNKNPVFKCLTTKGVISGGKKAEVIFRCTPNSLDLVESFWRFSIPSLSLSTPFLLVSSAVEPAVSMDRAYLNFKAMLLGSECHEVVYLINDEPQVYSFSFVETSCYCDGHTARVKVQPMSGTVKPNSKLPIHVSFVATREREYNFNLQCQVKNKSSPIILNVKAEGYLINYTLHYEDGKGSMAELLTGKGLSRCIKFDKVEVQEKCLKQICLVNMGKYSFEYAWELADSRGVLTTKSPADSPIMSIRPLEGKAEPNQRTTSELIFCPHTKLQLKGTELILKIKNGPTLPITLTGEGVEPIVHLSFSEHNFGPCFIHRAYMPPKQITLSITNKDAKDISLNCLYVNKPYLEVHTDPGVKPPGKVTEATISFLPRDTVKYCETIWFEVNGLSRVPLIIKGEGTQMKVEVANPAQKVVNFGALSIGSKTTKLVKVINRSLTSITFTVSMALSSAVLALQQEEILSIAPTSEITLKANGGTHTIEVTFKPTMRVPSFSEEVMLECSGLSQPLFMVTGSCHGIEITLDTYHIPFGAVVLQSQSSRRVLLLNTGDIGAGFEWDVSKFAPDFTITPVEGYISPGMEIPFDITFCPKQTNRDIRYENVPCNIKIEGSKPLYITLTGTCIEQIPLKEVLHFTTTVRGQESRQITLHNRTTTPWLVRPIIDGEYWSGANTISIDPGHPKHYELTYAPLRMTNDTAKHHGSIFFPFPDGNGLLYNLLGTAEPPKQAGSIYQEVPCKTSHVELLRVTNWLRRPQRFRAVVEMIKPDKQDRSITLNGLDYIDVPALGRKDYRLNFYTYKEGSFSAKVTFRNEQTLEYIFYNVHFKATPPGTMATISLTTTVRKNVSHTITVFNPLPSPVTMNTNVSSQDINMPTSFIVGAESEGACMFEYLPLKVGESTAKLAMTSNELGLYQYELRLVSNPSPPERTVHFTTTIGNSLQQLCKFTSFAKARTEFICKVDNTDFHVERNLTVASAGSSGAEATVEVTFEPSHLGDTKGNLTITSQSGGDYTIPLIGHCLVPKPQGPYTIKAGLNITIPFKNVFTQPTHFTFTVDNPVFSVKATELLKPKKVCNLLVSYDKQADPQLTKTGKLVVTCPPGTPGASAGLQWIYYLKGIVPQN